MKNLLCVLSVVAMVFAIGTAPNVALAGDLTVTCDEAQNMLETCSQGSRLACTDCCNQNFSGLYTDCYEICYTRRGQTNDKRIAGCNDGTGGGNTCANGSCSSSSDCANNTTAKVCDNGCCREPNSNETVTIKTPVCNGSATCACKFIGGGAGDNFETWLLSECGVYSGSGNGQNSGLGFPQTDCQSTTASGRTAVLEYGNNSTYDGCNGYVQQSYSIGAILSCTTCKSGFERKAYSTVKNLTYGTDYYSQDYGSWPCSHPVDSFSEASDIYVCVKMCEASYGTWTSAETGYEKRTVSYPTGCTQGTWTEYRCAAGYYSSTGRSSATSTSALGCTRCGTIEGIPSTSAAGSTSCKSCCVPAGSTGSDTSGSFTITTECCFTSC